ncbi:TPA: hypothetical protein ACH3X1_002836 [Trebouxia sp. C0004]
MAVAAAMTALGLTGLALGTLPRRWARGWNQKHFALFAEWPAGGQTYDNTYAIELLNHFVEALTIFDVPMGVGGFDFKDVRNYNGLSFACATGAFTIMFKGGTDAVVIPHGAIPWQGQTQVLFDWKRPSELQSVESVVTQAQLELMGALSNSRHPALVVFTDGVNYVILQPWGCAVQYWHTFPTQMIASRLMMLSGSLLIICSISVPGMLHSITWIVFEKALSWLWSLPHFWLQRRNWVRMSVLMFNYRWTRTYQPMTVLKLCQTPYWLGGSQI